MIYYGINQKIINLTGILLRPPSVADPQHTVNTLLTHFPQPDHMSDKVGKC